jgi:hypothetical protein
MSTLDVSKKNMKKIILILLLTASTVFAGFKYQPEFSEFSVTYPSEPKALVMAFTGNDGVDAEALHTMVIEGYSVLKAEFIPVLDSSILDAQSDEQIRSQMLDYARHNGLKVSHASVEQKNGIRIAVLRGTKLQGADKTPVTYFNKTYYGRRSMLMVYTAAPSELYPTKETKNFLDSVKW